ncbi:MAG: MFS transporter [Jatrophihabitans sp.]|uniref:MFS transporter n=1 Tax=Jatrophihabitans sp. TaxID=1932789 RepID=UPI003F81121E
MTTAVLPAPALPRATVDRARRSVFVVFALAGIAFASFASRIPDAKAALGLSAGELGALLLSISAGSLTALPSAGRIVGRFGAARTYRTGMAVSLTGLTWTGIAITALHSSLFTALGLYLVGLGIGCWDVAMNLEGAAVERHLGVTVMPRFHASFSAGTVGAGLVGAGMSRLGVPLLVHFLGVVLIGATVGTWAAHHFLPAGAEDDPTDLDASVPAAPPRSAWRERRTLLIGLVVLAAAFTEGTANDWLAVAFVDGHHVANWAGVLALATFLTSMTAGRLVGTSLLDRYGRVLVVRLAFLLAGLGSLTVVFGTTAVAFVGAALWGLGASLGFPVGISASADDPDRAAARMSVVATIGYTAFIAGPPLLGFLGDHFSVLRALLVVTGAIALAMLAVPALRPPRPLRPDTA